MSASCLVKCAPTRRSVYPCSVRRISFLSVDVSVFRLLYQFFETRAGWPPRSRAGAPLTDHDDVAPVASGRGDLTIRERANLTISRSVEIAIPDHDSARRRSCSRSRSRRSARWRCRSLVVRLLLCARWRDPHLGFHVRAEHAPRLVAVKHLDRHIRHQRVVEQAHVDAHAQVAARAGTDPADHAAARPTAHELQPARAHRVVLERAARRGDRHRRARVVRPQRAVATTHRAVALRHLSWPPRHPELHGLAQACSLDRELPHARSVARNSAPWIVLHTGQ